MLQTKRALGMIPICPEIFHSGGECEVSSSLYDNRAYQAIRAMHYGNNRIEDLEILDRKDRA